MSGVEEFERLSELIDFVYRGATEPALWPDIVASASAWLGSPKGMLYTPLHGPEQGGFYFQHGLPHFFLDLYKARYQAVDLWTHQAVARSLFNTGNVLLGTDLVPHAVLVKSQWHQECLQYGGISRLLTSVIFDLVCGEDPSLGHPDLARRTNRRGGAWASARRLHGGRPSALLGSVGGTVLPSRKGNVERADDCLPGAAIGPTNPWDPPASASGRSASAAGKVVVMRGLRPGRQVASVGTPCTVPAGLPSGGARAGFGSGRHRTASGNRAGMVVRAVARPHSMGRQPSPEPLPGGPARTLLSPPLVGAVPKLAMAAAFRLVSWRG